jgi:hypothetical protein
LAIGQQLVGQLGNRLLPKYSVHEQRTEKRRIMKERKVTGIKTWPEDDKPREKLLKKGAGALQND